MSELSHLLGTCITSWVYHPLSAVVHIESLVITKTDVSLWKMDATRVTTAGASDGDKEIFKNYHSFLKIRAMNK